MRRFFRTLLGLIMAAAAIYLAWLLYSQWKVDDNQRKQLEALAAQSGTGANPYADQFAQYKDMVAWVRIDGTPIDYPVMQMPGRGDYYLHHDLEGNESKLGVPYLQENCDLNASSNLVIYSHNMKNGVMFGPISNYTTSSYWQEHPTILLTTESGTREYRVFAAIIVDVDAADAFDYWDFVGSADLVSYQSFVQKIKQLALYDTGIVPDSGKQILTLSTCEYSHTNGRLAVFAERVS